MLDGQKRAPTPGPWEVREDIPRVKKSTGRVAFSVWSEGGMIAIVLAPYTIPLWTEAEEEANARLIAAAPEMLAALKRVSGWMEQHGTAENQGVACDVFGAIRKAEGGAR